MPPPADCTAKGEREQGFHSIGKRSWPQKGVKGHKKEAGGLISADSCFSWCDSVYYSDAHRDGAFHAGDIVFCKIDEVLRFFERLRLTRKRIVLVTGQGDLPCDEFRQSFLPVNVVHWFATNVTCKHPRVTALPLGLGPQGDAVTPQGSEIAAARAAAGSREGWLYVNFRPDTNPTARKPVFEHFQNLSASESWITFRAPRERGSNAEFPRDLVSHRFVLCPPGNGVDTHRMWEALVAGAIPVVVRSVATEPFRVLPILFVDDLRDVTLDMLQARWEQRESADSTLTEAAYWESQIRKVATSLRGREILGVGEWMRESLVYGVSMVKRRIFPPRSVDLL